MAADLRSSIKRLDLYFILSLVIRNLMGGNTHMSSLISALFYTCLIFRGVQKRGKGGKSI